MQVHAHVDGSMQMFSRRGREHCEWSSYDILLPVFDAQLAQRPCILDGELVVFNKIRCAALLLSLNPCSGRLLTMAEQ